MPGREDREATARWKPPPAGWLKLNCDGSVTNHGNFWSLGGCARDEFGNFIFGFSQ